MAIAVAFFFAYLVPTIVLFTLGGIGAARSDGGSYSSTWLSLLLIFSYALSPLAGGYLAARIAQRRPYLHAVLLSVVAGMAAGLLHEEFSIRTTLMWSAIFTPGGIAGAWVFNRSSAIKPGDAT